MQAEHTDLIVALDAATLTIALAGLVLGGFLKGATGAGTPVVGVPVLTLAFDIQIAVAVFSVINLVTNAWQAWAYRAAVDDARFVWRFSVGGAVGAVAGTVLLVALPGEVLMVTLALIVFAYVGLRLARPDWQLSKARAARWVVPVGLAGGVLQGAGGLSAPVSVTFLNAMRPERAWFIAVISCFFLAMCVTQVPALALSGLLTWTLAGLGLVALLPICVGMWAGARVARYLSKTAFDRGILGLLTVIAVTLLWEALR